MNAAPAGAAGIDWTQPWLQAWRPAGESVAREWASGLTLAEALNRAAAAPVRFVPQSAPVAGMAFEAHVHARGECPTREGLHDFFHGLCWHRFPQVKTRLNQLQAHEIARRGAGAVRGPVRDAITVFDENAALLHAPDALWAALAARQWRRLFVDLRPLWGEARLVLFGHALLAKLVRPRKPITAHVFRLDPGEGDLAAWDGMLAAALDAPTLAAKPFLPLPVLGVPGWWAANEDPAFYEDAQVFRPLPQQGQ